MLENWCIQSINLNNELFKLIMINTENFTKSLTKENFITIYINIFNYYKFKIINKLFS